MKKIANTAITVIAVTLLGSLFFDEMAQAQRSPSYPLKYCLRTYDGCMDCR